MNKIKLEPLSEVFLETLRNWRNQDRFFFLDQRKITPDMQTKWFKKYQANPGDTIFIVFLNQKPVGCLSLTKSKNGMEVGRVMLGEKEFSQKGIMSKALKLAISKFSNQRIFLEVKKENILAINFYKKNNFHLSSQTKDYWVMEYAS